MNWLRAWLAEVWWLVAAAAVPVGIGVALGLVCQGAALLLIPITGTFVIAGGAMSAYWASCRAADRWGQPWGALTFLLELGSIWVGICAMVWAGGGVGK